ncbi:MAG TPA: hypothetical protein VK956_04630 [Verrucomicrobium sp.]|nr:hypothetical protein [Verrucomicrobium sp.]
MNADDFEKQLRDRVAVAGLVPHDPTPQWKQAILDRAMQEASRATTKRSPRWLLTTLGAAWALIAVLHFTTPESTAPGAFVARHERSAPMNRDTDVPYQLPPWQTLTALNSTSNATLTFDPADLP